MKKALLEQLIMKLSLIPQGIDYINIPKRTISRIDFRFCASYGNVIDLRDNHWSLSLVFQTPN